MGLGEGVYILIMRISRVAYQDFLTKLHREHPRLRITPIRIFYHPRKFGPYTFAKDVFKTTLSDRARRPDRINKSVMTKEYKLILSKPTIYID